MIGEKDFQLLKNRPIEIPLRNWCYTWSARHLFSTSEPVACIRKPWKPCL